MPFEKFSADNFLVETLKELKMSINCFWGLQYRDAVGKSTIEKSINGMRELDRYEAPQLVQLCRELRALQEVFPVPIDWRDIRTIRGILANRREQAEKDQLRHREQQNAQDKQEVINSL